MQNRLLSAKATLPDYDRAALVARMVHLGFGAFHRAHQGVYTDILAAEQHSDWGYYEVNLIGGEQQIADLKQQDNLYTVAEMSADAWTARVVGVVKAALHVQVDGLERVLAAMCEPQIAIVSLTITEKGYCHSPATGQLLLEHPMIAADLQNPHQPLTAPGIIVEALARRKAAGLPAFTVMSCDNMPENGHVTRQVVTAYAREVDAELAIWIEQNVTFPSTMVDRIVPAVTPETLDKIEQLTGVRDPAGVACEPFRQWVIEDTFVAGRPQWENAGATLVADVVPFEEMKLRMLNGSHSFLAYLGYLAGYQHINDCMADDNYRLTAQALMLREQAPTLKVQGVDLQRYADQLIARYRNRRCVIVPGRLRWMAARNFRSVCWTPFAGILLIIAILICWRWAWRGGCVTLVAWMNRARRSTLAIRYCRLFSAPWQTVKKAPVVLRRCWEWLKFSATICHRRRGLRKKCKKPMTVY